MRSCPRQLSLPRSPSQAPGSFGQVTVDYKKYGVGLAFLPADAAEADRTRGAVEKIAVDEGLRIVGWRAVPVDASMIGPTAHSVMPSFWHCFVDDPAGATGIELDVHGREQALRRELASLNAGPLSAEGLDRLVTELLALTKAELA